ncbi:DUF3060 domain-containing protein [Curtobacterium aetherium]|uniref:DUF3060 domain-containing protein n=1 Tax=Curtobacterium aetherium TaxID=2841594 RepID=UPI003B52C9F2
MQTSRLTATLLAASATALLLAGCSGQPTGHTADTPSPTPSATIDDAGAPAPYDNACDGKQAVISGDSAPHEIDHCDAIAVTTKGSRITIGSTTSMVVEGSNNDITVDSVERITMLGSNNTVHVDGDTPTVDDQGQGNTVD